MTQKFKFREKAKDSPAYSVSPGPDLLDGYINPKGMLDNEEQIDEVIDAINTLNKFLDQAIENEVLLLQ